MPKNQAGRDGVSRKKDSLAKKKEEVKKNKRQETAALFFKPMKVVPDKIVDETTAHKEGVRHR